MGRPGHISPCTGHDCIVCGGKDLTWEEVADISVLLQKAVHRAEHESMNGVKLWTAKVLVDEVMNELLEGLHE